MSNILFYSDKCQYSMMFIKKLNDDNILQDFKLINILELKEIPQMITNVPTIIIKNISVPLIGLEAFKWLDNNKYFFQQTNNINNASKINSTDTVIQQNSNTHFLANNHKISNDFANLKDEDDDKITNIKYNGAKQNTSIIDNNTTSSTISNKQSNINFKVTDTRISQDVQTQKLNELLNLRKLQMKNIMDETKTIKKA